MSMSSGQHPPFKLIPVGKGYLWGGTSLRDIYDKKIEITPLAETWECSVHPDGLSLAVLKDGSVRTLASILEQYPEIMGTHPSKEQFPILVKLIDAKYNLSVQVHPDDGYAKMHENQSGKTELWYVIDAKPETKLIYGFSHEVSPETIRKNIDNQRLLDYLHFVRIKKGDVFYVEPGTVHAIGAGALIAEVQQNSNITYRLFDYGRKDKQGNMRTLHIEKAIDVMSRAVKSNYHQRMHVTRYTPAAAHETICRCEYFQVDRIRVNGTYFIKSLEVSFYLLLIIGGKGILHSADTEIELNMLDCVFIPANTWKIKVLGTVEFLIIRC